MRGKQLSERSEDAMLLVVKLEKRAMSQDMQADSRSWKWQGNPFSSRTTRKNASQSTP